MAEQVQAFRVVSVAVVTDDSKVDFVLDDGTKCKVLHASENDYELPLDWIDQNHIGCEATTQATVDNYESQ